MYLQDQPLNSRSCLWVVYQKGIPFIRRRPLHRLECPETIWVITGSISGTELHCSSPDQQCLSWTSESSEGSKREVVWPSGLKFEFYLTTRKAFPDQQNLNFTSKQYSIKYLWWILDRWIRGKTRPTTEGITYSLRDLGPRWRNIQSV